MLSNRAIRGAASARPGDQSLGAGLLTGRTYFHVSREAIPMSMTAEERAERARGAALTRHHPDQPEIAAAPLRHLRALRAERYIRDLGTVLTAEERTSLAALLLRTGGDSDVAS
jgi:hypothetical protein